MPLLPVEDAEMRKSRHDGTTVNPPLKGLNHPSTAHYENGEYVPCPLNQPYAYQRREAHDNGQFKHVTAVQGYCKAHKKLGCEVCTE